MKADKVNTFVAVVNYFIKKFVRSIIAATCIPYSWPNNVSKAMCRVSGLVCC